jgi:hypothetical protein
MSSVWRSVVGFLTIVVAMVVIFVLISALGLIVFPSQ